MAVTLEHDRWSVSKSDFSAKVMIPDLNGFFGRLPKNRVLVIEPGTRALVIDDGLLIGEIPAGSYTLETFLERLQFWRKKQATIFLTRCEDVPVDSHSESVPCLDGVCFDIRYRWTVQINDVLPFLLNLMGAMESVSVAELENLLKPIVGQAVYSTVGQSTFDDVRNADFVIRLANGVRSRIDLKLERYGLKFIDLQSAECVGQVGGLQERTGELWLASRETQLLRAASQIENEQLSARLNDTRSKVSLRKQLREAVSADELNKLQSRDDFDRLVAAIDKDHLLRREERESLVAAYEERKSDRNQLRDHLLATMEIHREQELEELRTEMDFAVRSKSLEKQIELSRLSQTKDSQDWRHELEREKEDAAHRRQQKMESVKGRWERIRVAGQQKREELWASLVHQQRAEDLRAEMELARANRNRQVALIQSELATRLESDKLEIQKRQQEWSLELSDRQSVSQLDRLQRIQDMNALFAERQHKLRLELENLKADGTHKREMDRLSAMSGLSTEALIATADTQNATLLADLKKHEASQESAKAQAQTVAANQLNDERLAMYERMNSTEKAKADAIAEAYKSAMNSQQATVQQLVIGQAQQALAFTRPPTMSPPIAAAPQLMPSMETWYVSLNGQQSQPLQLSQVQQHIMAGHVTAATMIWKPGLPNWIPASHLAELAPYLGGGLAVPSPMPPTPPPM